MLQLAFCLTFIALCCITPRSAFRRSPSIRCHINPLVGNRNGGINRLPPGPPFSKLFLGSDDIDNATKSAVDGDKSDNVIVRKWRTLSKESKDDVVTTIVSFSVALLVRLFLIEPRFIPSLSMFPTFDIGDQLLVDKVSKVVRPFQRRDVVVFNPPEAYIDLTGNTEALIKRIVAIGGDAVEVKDRHLYVNGILQVENYINDDPDYDLPLTTVPKGMLLVLGDNRNRSFDSHVWGFLPERNIVGRAVLKYWPPSRVGFVEGSQ